MNPTQLDIWREERQRQRDFPDLDVAVETKGYKSGWENEYF